MTNRKTFCKSGPRFPGTDVGRGQGGANVQSRYAITSAVF